MLYEWDQNKAASNLRKHKVNFADAIFVLEDELALTVSDSHPAEERYITIGADGLGRVLVVVWTFREENIRLISARVATASERRQYAEEI